MNDRRNFFARLGALGAAIGVARKALPAAQQTTLRNVPVTMPDLPKLPHKLAGGVKEFHLIAEVVRTEFAPGRPVDAWGFNGSLPGPTIEIDQGDRVRVVAVR